LVVLSPLPSAMAEGTTIKAEANSKPLMVCCKRDDCRPRLRLFFRFDMVFSLLKMLLSSLLPIENEKGELKNGKNFK
jgi:hypothetical protein